jgi:hypothetical protein
MHMDESKNPIPLNELGPWSAPDPPSTVDAFPAGLAGCQPHSDQLDPNDLSGGDSVVVYCGNEDEVSRGFLIALRAMGVAVVEQPAEPAKPPVARAKP